MSEPAREDVRDNVVSLGSGAPGARVRDASGGVDERRRRWAVVALALGLALMTLLFLVQLRRADALERQVTRLAGELETSRRTVEAYRGHLDQVRGQVGDLSQRMQALRDLVESDPQLPEARRPRPAAVGSAEEGL